ncbi:MAG: TlpA family protein disulfide reductase [Daejeonella sp.]
MKKPIKYIVLAALCYLFSAAAVHSQTVALKIGDRLPDITVGKAVNYIGSTLKLSDFKGKLLILDFWATWCGACLKSIPLTDSLQKAFEGKVVFLSVTYQTDEEVDAYLAKLEKLKPDLDARKHVRIVEDRVLHQLFPHTGLPHYVWINADGIVSAITDYQALTVPNISRLIEEGRLNTIVKKDDPLIPHKKEIPILSNLEGKVPPILFHTLLSGYVPGLAGGMDILPASETQSRKILLRNTPLTSHYRTAYGAGKKWFGDANIELEVKDPLRLKYAKDGNYNGWLRENGYCYELQLPRSLDSTLFLCMQDDLKKFFPQYVAAIEKRTKKVLALVRTSALDKIASSGGASDFRFSGLQASMKNTGINMLTSQLSVLFLQYLPMPIVNDTGYRGKVDLELNADLSDVKSINSELKKYDLQFIEKEKEVEVLVIRDKPSL